jgi:hypothetical protein
MQRIVKGRKLAALLLGSDAPVSVLDAFLIECHEKKLTGEQIVDLAKERRPVHHPPDTASVGWNDAGADSLLEAWVEPTDVRDAVMKLHAMEVLLQRRRVLLGLAYDLVRIHQLWAGVPGCRSLEELCRVRLRIGQRTFQRYAREARMLARHPELMQEVLGGGITLDRAMFALERSGDSALARESWLELVRRLGRVELDHASDREGDLRKAYAPVLSMAQAVESLLQKNGGEASGTGSTAERIAKHLRNVGATGPILVSLREGVHARSPERPPKHQFASPELLAASMYTLGAVVLGPFHGTRRMVSLDQFTCQNPRCRRRTLEVHPHHMEQRQHGGSDEPRNLVTLCKACHLRGIHSGQMDIRRVDDWLVWTWRDGSIVVTDSPVRELVYERHPARRRIPGGDEHRQVEQTV